MLEEASKGSSRVPSQPLHTMKKIAGLHTVLKQARIGMLTTHGADGQLHSRAMVPTTPFDDTQLTLLFLANNATGKFEEIKNDAHVNVSFCDVNSTSWASYAGSAKISQDKELIQKHWSSSMSAYFGDLKDGIHTGKADDPRISIIEVVPNEIRYWVPTKGAIGRAADTAMGMVTGKATAPGEIRTIDQTEIQLTQKLHTK
ncbi:Protein bli-3 [Mycena kentingensis (nom. inval.)]|nr:Protein bli-3 [Mycena kentingensis (nom. inval.)]